MIFSACTGLEWENMGAAKEFPVLMGTVMTLHCKEGYGLQGDEIVTCIKNEIFEYSAEPQCGEH